MLAIWVGWALAAEPLPVLEAESMRYEKGVVYAEKGKISDEKGMLRFERAEIVLEGGALEMEEVEIAFENGWFIRADRMVGVLNGPSTLEGASITACDCDCPVWALEAATLRITGPEAAILEDAVFALGPLRIPLPDGEVPLEPKPFGIGLPGVRWELGDLMVDLPLVIRFRPGTDLELRPGWWRGPRLAGSLVSEGHTEASWAVEWGEEFAALAQVDHAQGGARWGTGVRGFWVDRPESIVRAKTYLMRQMPYTEQVARAWVGPLRAEGWAWQGEDEGARWQLELVEPVWGIGPFTGDHALSMGLLRGQWRTAFRAGTGLSKSWGPLEGSFRGDVRVLDYHFMQQAVDATGQVEGGLVFWAQHGAWNHEIRLGAKAQYAERVVDMLSPLSALDLAPNGSGIGPQVESQWWGPGFARLDGWMRMDASGATGWSALARYKQGDLELQAQSHLEGEEGLHGAMMRQASEGAELWFGLYGLGADFGTMQPVLSAGARVGIPLKEAVLWPGASALMVEDRVATLNAGVHLESNCECFLVGIDAGWAEDRDEVTVGISFDLLPKAGGR
jgi:hypothetical protein